MSQFSERLKIVLSESGTNIYQLSKNAKLDRTTIQRALTGERLPSQSFVEKLCEFLRVSPLERSELLELHTIARVGEKVYAGRKYIKDMIEHMATMHIKPDSFVLGRRSVKVGENIENGIKSITGEYNVQNLIRDILEDEVFNEASPKIYLTVPFENTFLFELLQQLYLRSNSREGDLKSSPGRKLVIKHIIKLSKNPLTLINSNYNLNVLSNILPYAFSEWGGYQPYYYYGNPEASRDICFVLPYYILTSKHLIRLSADFNTAVLIDNAEIYDIYSGSFEKSLLQTRPLLRQLNSCEKMLEVYLSLTGSAQLIYVLEPQPCFGRYYTNQMMEDKLRKDLEDHELLKMLLFQLYDNYKNFIKVPASLFSIEGLEYMAETGKMADLPPEYALPFSVDERKMLITKLKKEIEDDIYFSRAVNSAKFIISPFASIQLYDNNVLMIITVNSEGIPSSSIIEEKSIYEAFLDFFESMEESNMLCSKEESIKILDQALAELNKNQINL